MNVSGDTITVGSKEYFNGVIFDACDENKDLWRLEIDKSGFEKNEYKIEFQKDEYNIYLKRLIQGYARILCSQEIMYAKNNKVSYKELKYRLKKICKTEK